MTDMHRTLVAAGLALAGSAASFAAAPASEILAPAKQRFGGEKSTETPDFQKHVLPMMGRVGCNGRSCHGSFQGQGGFRLSLFGYDFTADHDALLKGEKPRIEPGEPEESKAVKKATGRMPHKGGKVIAPDSWEHKLLARWIEAGAKPAAHKASFAKLEVTPAEIVFTKPGEKIPLRVVAVWSDGVREDVTCLARFRTNDESIVKVDAEGVVSAAGKGDTHVVAFYDNGVHAVPAMLAVSDKIGANYPAIATPTKIDALVVEKLKKVGIVPSEICTDGEFLRRVSLDLTGTLPSPAEIDAFSKSKDPEKRPLKIEELLKRPAYAAWWTTKLCDVTGQNLGQLQEQQLQQVRYAMYRGWYDWIRKRVEENVPYDKIVEGIVLATSREKGQTYEQYAKQMSDAGRADKPGCLADRETMPFFWGRRNVAKSEEKALNFAYAFLGVRLQCAECHKHPFDQWTQQDFKQFTAFFNSIQYGLSPEARKFDQAFQEKLGLKQLKDGQDRQKKTSEAYAKGETVPVREVFVNAAVNARMNPKGKAAR
ncbi:MAG TPA: DUF1549 domain-containing protein, partial [Planctomycetia bacterium]|nr:DUF1549 domain-containing protein [Planctomycetia bacterium]